MNIISKYLNQRKKAKHLFMFRHIIYQLSDDVDKIYSSSMFKGTRDRKKDKIIKTCKNIQEGLWVYGNDDQYKNLKVPQKILDIDINSVHDANQVVFLLQESIEEAINAENISFIHTFIMVKNTPIHFSEVFLIAGTFTAVMLI